MTTASATLTKEQIEQWRERFMTLVHPAEDECAPEINAICDAANAHVASLAASQQPVAWTDDTHNLFISAIDKRVWNNEASTGYSIPLYLSAAAPPVTPGMAGEPRAESKLWFSNPVDAIRWMRDEGRQWHDDNPAVAAHLFECATMFENAINAKGSK